MVDQPFPGIREQRVNETLVIVPEYAKDENLNLVAIKEVSEVKQIANKKLKCRAIPKEDKKKYGKCSDNEFKLAQWCSGDCGGDDAKVTICCKYECI